MKNIRFLTFVLAIATLILGACSPAEATPSAAGAPEAAASAKAVAMPVAFIGIVDRMTGDQWVISGTAVRVDPAIVRDGPFNVGDRVKVEGFSNPDGSFTVERVEAPTPRETATLRPADDNSNDAAINANTNDDHGGQVNSNDDNSNSANTNDDHGGNTNTNDDNGNSANTNDDKGKNSNSNDDKGGSNSNDSNGNDDHSGSGGGDDNGNGG